MAAIVLENSIFIHTPKTGGSLGRARPAEGAAGPGDRRLVPASKSRGNPAPDTGSASSLASCVTPRRGGAVELEPQDATRMAGELRGEQAP